MIKTKEEAAALLERRLKESGLSTERFAVDVMIRQARTVRRWLDRSSPIPAVVLDFLEDPKVAPWPAPAFENPFATEVVGQIEHTSLRLAARRIVDADGCADSDCCEAAVELEEARAGLRAALEPDDDEPHNQADWDARDGPALEPEAE